MGGMFCIEVEIMETLNNIAATFEEFKKKKKKSHTIVPLWKLPAEDVTSAVDRTAV